MSEPVENQSLPSESDAPASPDASPETSKSVDAQSMKPSTAAKKLGILLAAAPADFQSGVVTRDEFLALQNDPPEWLATLRREGPHPRPVVAAKLGVSISGLTRADADEPLSTVQIKELLASPPPWLVEERARQAKVIEENVRVKAARAEAAAKRAKKAD